MGYKDPMLGYALVLVGSFLVDCIPVVAPPAWTLMLFFMVKFDLNPWLVVTLGTIGTVGGRMVFSQFIVPYVGEKSLGKAKTEDLKFLGQRLSGRGWAVFFFIFLYSLLPLSTTALFTAAGLARMQTLYVIPPFFLGNFIGDTFLIHSGKYTITQFNDVYAGAFSLSSVALMLAGLLAMAIFLFIDWRLLLEKKKFRLKWTFRE